MLLEVYLPRPPEGLFEQPDGIFDPVRDGVLEWTDVAAPDVPGFVFIENKGDADIPILWAAEPDGAGFIAYCAHEASFTGKPLDIRHILVPARWGNGDARRECYATRPAPASFAAAAAMPASMPRKTSPCSGWIAYQ